MSNWPTPTPIGWSTNHPNDSLNQARDEPITESLVQDTKGQYGSTLSFVTRAIKRNLLHDAQVFSQSAGRLVGRSLSQNGGVLLKIGAEGFLTIRDQCMNG